MISSYLQDSKDIIWDAKTMHLCCIGHVINLAVQAFLFFEWDSDMLGSVTSYNMQELGETDNPEQQTAWTTAYRTSMKALGKLHNINIHIQGSAQHTAEF